MCVVLEDESICAITMALSQHSALRGVVRCLQLGPFEICVHTAFGAHMHSIIAPSLGHFIKQQNVFLSVYLPSLVHCKTSMYYEEGSGLSNPCIKVLKKRKKKKNLFSLNWVINAKLARPGRLCRGISRRSISQELPHHHHHAFLLSSIPTCSSQALPLASSTPSKFPSLPLLAL